MPEKFQQYLAWPNSTLVAQLATAQARDGQLALRVAVDWNNNQHLAGTTEETITVLDPAIQTTSTPLGIPVASTSEILVEENNVDAVQPWSTAELPLREQPTLRDAPLLNGANLEISSERVTIWVDDQLLNDLFQQFRWDFEWMVEEIPVESPKLPSATREFLSTLCTNCYFLLKVSANGSPHISAVNESIVLEKFVSKFLF